MLRTKKVKLLATALLCFVMLFATTITAHGHGLFVLVGPEDGGTLPANSAIHAEVGELVVVTGGWGYNFLGPDGGVHTGHLHRVTVISPDGTRTELPLEWCHQFNGRDDHTRPINRPAFHRIGVDPFPVGGRHNIFVQTGFTPQSEGYYQVVFERFAENVNLDNPDHANYGLQVVQTAHITVMVGDPEPVAGTGFAEPIGTGRLEIIPTTDVGRLTHEEGVLEGVLLLDGRPLPNQRIRINIPGSGILDGTGGHNDWMAPDDFETDTNGRFSISLPALGLGSPGFYSIQVPSLQVSDVAGTVPGTDVRFTRMNEVYLFHFYVPPTEYDARATAADAVQTGTDNETTSEPAAIPGLDTINPHETSAPQSGESETADPEDSSSVEDFAAEGSAAEDDSPGSNGSEINEADALPRLFTTGNILSLIGGGVLLFAAGLLLGLTIKSKKL